MWNQRYSSDSCAYGTKPNDFLMEMSDNCQSAKYYVSEKEKTEMQSGLLNRVTR